MNPILFHAFKHHLAVILQQTAEYAMHGSVGMPELLKELKSIIGLVDIYYGDLSANAIEQEVLEFIKSNNLADIQVYRDYLEKFGECKRQGDYMCVTLSDTSLMVLRLADNPYQFVHIHPARHSPHTFRIKSNTLKTVIVTHFLSICSKQSPYTIEILNNAREYLELPPILEIPTAIEGLLQKFEEQTQNSLT
ncbi:MAG: hypothetical protein GY754_39725 [bacterium]|nr:hypothetical protein [bacterium]